MGVAKAALEACVRYLAADLGPQGHSRERHLRRPDQDAGGRRHLRASRAILQHYRDRAPLRRTVDTAEVADAALFLLGSARRAVTAEVLMVDGGYHATGM